MVNALTSLMWLLLQGTAVLAVARGEAHYHRIAGHETAEAVFLLGEAFLPTCFTKYLCQHESRQSTKDIYLLVWIYSCNNRSLGEVSTLLSDQQATRASELAEISELGSHTRETSRLNSCFSSQAFPLGHPHPFVPTSLSFSDLKL